MVECYQDEGRGFKKLKKIRGGEEKTQRKITEQKKIMDHFSWYVSCHRCRSSCRRCGREEDSGGARH